MDQPTQFRPDIASAEHLIGTWRRFGAIGPVYEIRAVGQLLPDGDRMMRVTVVESGEELDYKLSMIADDPSEE